MDLSSVNVTFRVDENVKKQADALFDELGMSLSTAFNVFLRQSIREQGLPFEVSKSTPNAATLAAMDDAELGRTFGPFDSVEDLMEALNA